MGTSTPGAALDIKAGANGIDTLVVRPGTGSNFFTVKPEGMANAAELGYWTGPAGWGTLFISSSSTVFNGGVVSVGGVRMGMNPGGGADQIDVSNTTGSAYLFAYSTGGTSATVGAWGASGPKHLLLNPAGGAGAVGIGTSSPCATNAPANWLLSVAGGIQAQEVVVNTGWSDYVFDPKYRLMPLGELSHFIASHGHLPEIPSAAEVERKGVSVGEMQSKLLAKIEELTLHMIQTDARIRQLEQENLELRAGTGGRK